MWDNFFDKSSENARFLMIGHSQGVIHMRNALLDYPLERSSRIFAVGLAPAAYIYDETVGQVRHYRAKSKWGDSVPRIDRMGASRTPSSVIDLPSHSYIPFIDHSLQRNIYKQHLENETNKYISK
jgi:hypothetical protein